MRFIKNSANKQYSFVSKNNKFQLHTSSKEIKDLLVAWLFISVAFAIARTIDTDLGFLSIGFTIMIAISAVTVGLGFLFHEMAHKIVAQKYHCWAEFRMDLQMLVLAVLMSFLGFIFIAPGAVMIYGHITEKQNGKISMAGPLTNIIITIILLPLLFLNITNPLLIEIISSGFLLNAWLGLFNMIPLGNFDGIKIYRWNKLIYFSMLAVSAMLVFVFFIG